MSDPRLNLRRVDSERLRELVIVADVLRHFGEDVRGERGRIACRLHGGANPSAFSFDRDRWHCFVCEAGGDVFELVIALSRCSFPEALALVARIAGLPVDGLPQVDTSELDRRQKIQRRRHALRHWRDQRLGEWLTVIGNLTRDVERLAPRYMDRARDQTNPDGDGWTLLASLHGDLQRAENMAAGLGSDEEREWARIWLLEQQGLVFKPEELRT